MSKQESAQRLDQIKEKIDMLINRECDRSKDDEVEEVISKKGKKRSRPRSAYILFCMDQRKKLSDKSLSFGEMSQQLSKMWSELPDSKKKKYQKASEEEKEKYASEKSS